MAWVVQRASAVYLAFFAVYLLLHFLLAPPADHLELRAWVAKPLVSLGLVVMVPLILAHAWVGMRDVFLDYVKILGLRVVLLSMLALVLVGSGLWVFKAIVVADIASAISG
jgi:succinate dehydrogenase / fumarate reductase membrane anchor subunit